MKKIYNSDKPISNQSEDKFNRYNFSKRIAETIVNRESEDGLVIGLYGVWGEGKTSILNILETELNCKENIIVIKFNPWRFTNEDVLILNFLKNISSALDKELLNTKERLGDFIKKYGSIGGIFNLDLSKVGESISDTELETLKNRVNDFLKDSKRKIVVIIDDIDRLDKNELFSLFKLVKLTGDFANTYYVLSFDDEMVASSIGDRYANGDKNSGYNFLEKIIQVPLKIPKALSKSLLEYTFQLVTDVLTETELELSENESQHLGYNISQYLLPKISTPRLAVRFSNSLSFLIPLLKGEVNHTDLILFEAIKIFYPEHYDFIKHNPHYFIETYDFWSGGKNNGKVEEIKKHLENLNSNLSKVEIKCITSLLTELFPRLNEALYNSYVENAENTWAKNKKIGSSKYFNRYFLYSVPHNELSDVHFDNFIKSLKNKSIEENILGGYDILENIDSLEFLNKLGFYEDILSWDEKIILIELITKIEDKFENIKGAFAFGMNNPKSQAAIAIYRLIKSNGDKNEQLKVAKSLISSDIPFDFSMEILRWLKVGKSEEEKIFNSDDYTNLNNLLLERALEDCENSESNLFEKYNEHIFRLLDFWHLKDKGELDTYIKTILNQNPHFVKNILYSLTSTMYSSSSPNPFKTDFKKDNFEYISSYTDIENIYSKVNENYKDEIEKEDVKFYDLDEGQNEINILRQFIHWYNKSKV